MAKGTYTPTSVPAAVPTDMEQTIASRWGGCIHESRTNHSNNPHPVNHHPNIASDIAFTPRPTCPIYMRKEKR
ncbi:hypothetical protein GCM10007416_27520 [Kroppenstedtia guangzhouensis]|uniref:Uncharacterized protein n=1 Tax=Kroppenstedtia guangzhouensis TaxID=1274356 RepID=A0ABQ1GZC4_9BACL|nr:hypothetical protein GCM10007416_27520 [Kroppenstedtia guangzhouensis]